MESYWWAAANGQADKLRQCILFRQDDAVVSPEYVQAELELRQMELRPLGVQAVRPASLSQSDPNHASVVIDKMHPVWNGPIDIAAVELRECDAWRSESETLNLRKVEGEWKVVRPETLAALQFRHLLQLDMEQAAQSWPSLPPEAANEIRSTMSPENIARFMPWMQTTNQTAP